MSGLNEHYKIESHGIHVTGLENDVMVWLNTEIADFDGLCIGSAGNRLMALTQAETTLHDALAEVRKAIAIRARSRSGGEK